MTTYQVGGQTEVIDPQIVARALKELAREAAREIDSGYQAVVLRETARLESVLACVLAGVPTLPREFYPAYLQDGV